MSKYRDNNNGLVFDETELELVWCNLDEILAELENSGSPYAGSFPPDLDVGLFPHPEEVEGDPAARRPFSLWQGAYWELEQLEE